MLRIQCPNCKEWVSVQYTPEMEELTVLCPYCRIRSPFKDWRKSSVIRNADDEKKKKEEEERKRREEEERRIREEEERKRREEEFRKKREEEELRKREAEIRRRDEEERKRREEEERKRREADEQRKLQEEQRLREEAERRQREADEQRRRREEEERRRREEEERLRNMGNSNIGTLVSLNSGNTYTLFQGRNVVGRMANSSTADIQIPDSTGMRRMSRSHLVINVLKENGRFVHYASLNSPSVNRTCVNSMPLIYGQQVLLHSGDIIDLPDEPIRFEVMGDNQEETELGFI